MLDAHRSRRYLNPLFFCLRHCFAPRPTAIDAGRLVTTNGNDLTGLLAKCNLHMTGTSATAKIKTLGTGTILSNGEYRSRMVTVMVIKLNLFYACRNSLLTVGRDALRPRFQHCRPVFPLHLFTAFQGGLIATTFCKCLVEGSWPYSSIGKGLNDSHIHGWSIPPRVFSATCHDFRFPLMVRFIYPMGQATRARHVINHPKSVVRVVPGEYQLCAKPPTVMSVKGPEHLPFQINLDKAQPFG
mmetsp:Transcript_18674/g.40648  ORF Transcript_18674/g.40648 Transcript_18674/m.40648 type:complete len:242 (-) Transcript_18674:592-1317(-)